MVQHVGYCLLMMKSYIDKSKLYIKQCYRIVGSVERIQRLKMEKLQQQKTEE